MRTVALLLLGSLVAAAPAAAEGLFVAAPGAREASGTVLGEVRRRTVTVDRAYLARRLPPRGRTADAAADATASDPTLVMELFDDVKVRARRERVEAGDLGGTVWTGDVAGDPFGGATLVLADDGSISGQVTAHRKTYRIEPAGGGRHLVIEIDRSRMPAGDDAVVPPGRSGRAQPPAERPAAERNAAATRTVDLLVVFTPSAAQRSRNQKADAQLAVSLANKALRKSRTQAKFRLAGVNVVKGYSDRRRSMSGVLEDATDGRGAFAAVHKLRDRVKADLVAVITTNDDACGLGWLLERPTARDETFGYSVTAVDCIAHNTVAHEAGHNLGLRHDRFVEDAPGSSAYNFGHVDLKKRFVTIMAYQDQCVARGLDCATLDAFSTPLVKQRGAPIGIAAGRPGAADNARALRENVATVAAFR